MHHPSDLFSCRPAANACYPAVLQMCILWSPVLRDMISLYPTPALLESTHGLAYLLHVEEEGATWAAVLDHMYPVPLQQQAATDWVRLLGRDAYFRAQCCSSKRVTAASSAAPCSLVEGVQTCMWFAVLLSVSCTLTALHALLLHCALPA